MAEVRAIRSEEDYDATLARITELMDGLSGPEGQVDDVDDPDRVELDVLTDLLELYEERHYPIGLSRPYFRHHVPDGAGESDAPRPCALHRE